MRRSRLHCLIVAFVLTLTVSGCIIGGSKKKEAPRVYITPCNVAANGVQVRVRGTILNANTIQPELMNVFVDDFSSPSAEIIKSTYVLQCYWGQYVGQRRDYYYCSGQYKAPELNEKQVISRWVWKSFVFGFNVDEHNVGTWVDTSGIIHDEGPVHYLTIKEITTRCWVA